MSSTDLAGRRAFTVSSDNIAKDLGQIHDLLFDHSLRIEKEARYIIRELEGKRNDREAQNLSQCMDHLTKAEDIFVVKSRALMDQYLDGASSQIQKCIEQCRVSSERIQQKEETLSKAANEKTEQLEAEHQAALKRTGTLRQQLDEELRRAQQQMEEKYRTESASSSSSAPSRTAGPVIATNASTTGTTTTNAIGSDGGGEGNTPAEPSAGTGASLPS